MPFLLDQNLIRHSRINLLGQIWMLSLSLTLSLSLSRWRNQQGGCKLTRRVSEPPMIFKPMPVLPRRMSISVSRPGMTGHVDGSSWPAAPPTAEGCCGVESDEVSGDSSSIRWFGQTRADADGSDESSTAEHRTTLAQLNDWRFN